MDTAFGSIVDRIRSWVATALGRNYEYGYAYFALGYEAIRHVIENGGRTLRWGTGAYDYKSRLGFELEENNYVCFKARNPGVDWAFRKLAGKLVEMPEGG